MNPNRNGIILSVIVAVILYFLYLVNDILFPFVVSIVIAYLLQPMMNMLEKIKFSPDARASVVLLVFFGVLAAFSLTVVPMLFDQFAIVANKAAGGHEKIKQALPLFLNWAKKFDPHVVDKLQNAVSDVSSSFLGFLGHSLTNILSSSIAVAQLLSLIFIAPIVLYYMLRDWTKMINGIINAIPKKYYKKIKPLVGQIDETISSYVRGQVMVCTIMAIFYSLGLSLIGIDAALAIGVISGLLTFIPYAGALFSAFLAVLIAAIQFGGVHEVSLVVSLYMIGQFIEGNFIVPYLIGGRVNLHPVWIMFGLLAGGALFGFVGVLVALPLTAMLGVIIRYAFKEMIKTKIYN